MILYVTVIFSLLFSALELTATLLNDNDGRSFLITIERRGEEFTVKVPHLPPCAVAQVTPVTVSVVKALSSLGAAQSIVALSFCLIVTLYSKE